MHEAATREKKNNKKIKNKKIKNKGIISLTPQTLAIFANTPLIFKNSHLPPLNFQKFSLTPIRTN
jgi:hypothetical protein